MKHYFSVIDNHRFPRAGFTLWDVLLPVSLFSFLALLCSPALLHLREQSRQQHCRGHLRALTLALENYHSTFRRLPMAAEWRPIDAGSPFLHRARDVGSITHRNWILELLPYLLTDAAPPGSDALTQPIADPAWTACRTQRLEPLICPSDDRNHAGNAYALSTDRNQAPAFFARGNYALNGGTHHFSVEAPSTSSPQGDFSHLQLSRQAPFYQLWGNGVGGINVSFTFDDFTQGRSTLIAVEELRAGLSPTDPRGVWALGQIGGSITWGHGVHGDDAGPNALHPRADDILGCPALHEEFPGKQLVAAGMPCVDYLDLNQQATARSQHPGGVLTAQLDGSVRFISNSIDPQVWHLLHSRETPAGLLSVSSFDTHRTMPKPALSTQTAPADLPQTTTTITSSRPETTAELPLQSNSLGMRFRQIPSGTFLMGQPDRGNPAPIPEDCPAHDVELSQAYWFGECEVTRDDWEKVLGTESLPSIPEGVEIAVTTPEETGRLPVTAISWQESQKFCAALGQRESEQRAGRTYRLPTEAEWERACRAGSRFAYRWQPERSADDQSGAAAGISPALPLFPTGSFPPNAWGLFDLRGNAWEWTSDWYARDFYRHSPVRDPTGPKTGWFKVARGSDWRFTGEACHGDSAVLPPWKASPVIGFRLVMEQQAGVNVHP